MKIKSGFKLCIGLCAILVFLLSGCALLNISSGEENEQQSAESAAGGDRTPRQTVEEYYDWYLDFGADPEEGRALLMDAISDQSDYLTQDLIQELEDLYLSSSGEGYDPFLCRQEIPQSLEFVDQPRAGKQASIQVNSSIPEYSFIVDLEEIEGDWKISSIQCQEADGSQSLPEGSSQTSPQEVVDGFYGWYLAYAQEQGDFLEAGVYRESEFLAESFVQKVDAIIQNSGQDGFDPFFCAQAVPLDYSVAGVVREDGIARAEVQTGSGEHTFRVALSQQGENWMISDVLCESGE